MGRASTRAIVFDDRPTAGRELARHLLRYRGDHTAVVVGLPRGGVPVAAEVASALGLPLDVIVVRKLGVPSQPELAMGAIGEGDVLVVDPFLMRDVGVTDQVLESVERRERRELDRRLERFRGDRAAESLRDRTVIVVDDGVATGSTARAACQVAREAGARRVVLATPVAPDDWTDRLDDVADELVAVQTPAAFGSVGSFYRDFRQVGDDAVVEILHRADASSDRHVGEQDPADRRRDGDRPTSPTDISILTSDGRVLDGILSVPPDPLGVVVFAHGAGSSRTSVRNRRVADALNEGGMATLLFDLLTVAEAADRRRVFDIDLLASRLTSAVELLHTRDDLGSLPLGLFGASTGAAAALTAAADPSIAVDAVVSRGGRPDLAVDVLGSVRAPTLLIVGGADTTVRRLNEEARRTMSCPARVVVVPGAGHLFEEAGALDQVAQLAEAWFAESFRAGADTTA